MRKGVFLLLVTCVLLYCASCRNGKEDEPQKEQKTEYALDVYWDDAFSGKLGIHVGPSKSGEFLMYLAGQPLFVTGVNCYNLFVQCHEADNMGTSEMEETVKVLSRQKVPVVRFSCGPFYAHQMHFYTEQKAKYLANLDKLASLCDQNHILLIPSFFWNTACVPEYCGEELGAWGNTSSKTYAFMLSYTEDVVNTLKGHKCIAAWEFGNEFNLAADIASAGYPDIKAASVGTAYKGFAQKVSSLDPHGRMVCSGNSVMRNAQWNLANNGSWADDSFRQYVDITGVMTPDPMLGMSEHVYEESRKFSDLGTVNRTYQLIHAKEAATSLGKAYYVGEFTGPKTAHGDSILVKKHYTAYYSQRVQLSLIWNYALRGNIEWSFKEGDYDDFAFKYMRAYNERFKSIKVD
ncbi:MAG: hypothetical protein IJK73_06650 [Bacteroidales bacterium]|nr:hypothetical protein [Bacteroidales bacterium]